MHGGNIYTNEIEYDFSVNLNPYGPYKEVMDAMVNCIKDISHYPQYGSESLKKSISDYYGISHSFVCVTNGASEAITALANVFFSTETIIEVPSFSGYKFATSAKGHVTYLSRNSFLKQNENMIKRDSLLMMGNPANPTGEYTDIFKIEPLYERVKNAEAYLMIDESFILLSDYSDHSFVNKIKENPEYYDRLIVVRSFTKSFSIPGVRLGYIISSNKRLQKVLTRRIPEWNVSLISQVAGEECIKNIYRLSEDYKKIKENRMYLEKELNKLGLETFKSSSSYILFTAPSYLYSKLLEKKILIRNCNDYSGIDEIRKGLLCENMYSDNRSDSVNDGIFRVSVKTKEENDYLINTIRQVL